MEKSESETPPPLALKSLLPPPAPRSNSSICSVDSLKRVHLPPPPPPPPPMINSSLSVSKGIKKDGFSISINSSSPAVPGRYLISMLNKTETLACFIEWKLGSQIWIFFSVACLGLASTAIASLFVVIDRGSSRNDPFVIARVRLHTSS